MQTFLQKLNISGTKTEITIIFNGKIKTIKKEEIEKYKQIANIYYLTGIRPDLEDWKRANDRDIIAKKSFTIDIDLRNQFEGTISNVEIVQEGLAFAKMLGEYHKLFGQWSYIIFTGNGLHITYIGKETTFTQKQYKLGVKYIFKMWDDFLGEKAFSADNACCNLARILRLPGSINQKNGAKVRILAEQEVDSELFKNINIYALIAGYDLIIQSEIARQEMMKKDYNQEGDDLYIKINQIPAYEIAQLLVPDFPFAKNNKNFKNKKGGFTGYYYIKETNTICNGGSRYFKFDGDDNSCWNNFSLIKNQYTFTNKETFNYFKDKFKL